MKQVSLDLSEIVCRAIAENLPDYSISGSGQVALQAPAKKIRIGVYIDKILRNSNSVFEHCGVRFNLNLQIATSAGQDVKLTEKEAALVAYLYENAGEASKQQILLNVWNYSEHADTRTVESHVHRLNSKLEKAFGSKFIVSKSDSYKLIALRD